MDGAGVIVGGGAGGSVSGGAFGGIGVSNYVMGALGLVIIAGLAAHIMGRHRARHHHHKGQHMRNALHHWDAMKGDDKRKWTMHHTHHEHPQTYEDAMGDVYSYTYAHTDPQTSMMNHDRIKKSLRRKKHHIKNIMDQKYRGEIDDEECHHQLHGISQMVFDELKLPHRDSIDLMPYTVSAHI